MSASSNKTNSPKIILSPDQQNLIISVCDVLHDCHSKGDVVGCFCDIGDVTYESSCKFSKKGKNSNTNANNTQSTKHKSEKCVAYDYIYNREIPTHLYFKTY